MKKIWLFLTVCFLLVSLKPAHAYTQTITFGDGSNYWLNWGNTDHDSWPGTDNNMDAIGIPDFSGGSAVVTNNLLTGLTINQSITSSAYWPIISPGDLFIDLGSNQTWDYVADLTGWPSSSANPLSNPDPAAGNYDFYSVSLALGNPGSSSGYILSGTDKAGDWGGYYIRDNHPVAVNFEDILDESKLGSVHFSGWNGTPAAQYSFNFSGLNGGGLNLGQSGQFTIGWQPNCANDVIYETVKYNPVPEPASMSLLGLGLLGLLGFKKRKVC